MKEYLSNYVGVVIQNNDPEMRGRIKVFIPNISSNIYKNWDEENTDKVFNFVDNSDIQKIIDDLKSVLPWAEYAGPIFGGCASARYNATLKKGVVSDTNSFEGDKPTEGYRPLNMYSNELAYPDAFSATGKVGNKAVNPYAYQYIPSNYSNLAKGMFSIPNVGSHIWVWFIGGDSNFPVYFASAYGQEDFKRIYTTSQKVGLEGKDSTSLHYPATYENKTEEELTSDAKTFRSKHVINSNKNSIEMVDTDGFEKLKFTQYGGSFLELNNETTTKLSTANDQTMVLGDAFETFQNDKNEYVGGICDLIIHGDSYEKIGNQNALSVNEIFNLYKSIHEYKTLFDVRRTGSNVNQDPVFNQNVTSPYQEQSGEYGICPVCSQIPYAQKSWNINPILNRMCLPIPLTFPGYEGMSVFTPVTQPLLDYVGQIGVINGDFCPLCNRNPNAYSYHDNHAVGFSPSTVNGNWNVEDRKLSDGDLGDLYKSSSSQIMDLQAALGNGGDKINNISRNYVLNVGLVMNNLQSYRVDTRGKLKTNAIYLATEGTVLQPEPTPHVEHVDVDPLPGGDLIVTAGNKLKFLVGSNGINIKTFGPIEMYGSITNLTSEQMNILAKHELFIDGGEKLSLRARHISLNPFEQNPVLVDGGLHVSRNAIIQGSMHVEGELGVQHITGPAQWYQTEPSGCTTILANTLIAGIEPHAHAVIIQIPDHTHYYLNLPMDLKASKEEARASMIELGINENVNTTAREVLFPDSATGNITSTSPIGGVVQQQAAQDQMLEQGIDAFTIDSVFSTISNSTDTFQLQQLYGSLESSRLGIGSYISDQTEVLNASLQPKLDAISQSLENIFSV